MRDLSRYPVTLEEIEAALLAQAKAIEAEESVGDMRPILFRAAAQIVLRTGFVIEALKDHDRISDE